MKTDRHFTRTQSTPTTPLRIAVVAACPFPSLQGSQVLIRQHAQALAARGHQVHVVAYHLGLSEPVAGVRLHRIPAIPFYRRLRAGPSIGKPFLDALLLLKLFAVARRERIDVFHAHNAEGVLAAWPVARTLRKPLVFHTHTLMAGELPAYFESTIARRLANRLGHWLDAALPRLADRTIVLSPEARATFTQLGAAPARLVYLPPGIDGDTTERRSAPAAVRERYRLGPGPLAIYTGNLDPYQGLDDLLRAFVQVRRRVPDAQLVIVTHTAPDDIPDLDGVRYIQAHAFDEAAALLDAGDVAVCPRPACLGYPIKLLNYMAAAKAIVCAAGSARHLSHLDNGYVYPDGDVDALAAGLIRLLTDRPLAQRLGQRAGQTIRPYRWPALAESFEALYRDLTQETTPTQAPSEAAADNTQHAIRNSQSLIPNS